MKGVIPPHTVYKAAFAHRIRLLVLDSDINGSVDTAMKQDSFLELQI